MRDGDLTTLDKVKADLEIADTGSDARLAQLISAQSRLLRTLVRRDILLKSYSEPRDGQGTTGISPYQYPLVSVEGVFVDGNEIPKQLPNTPPDPPNFGWVVSGDRIEIVQYVGSPAPYVVDLLPYFYGAGGPRYTFTRGYGNVLLKYTAGFQATDATAVPNSAPYEVKTIETFVRDVGASNASTGAALTKVSSNPGAGQYTVDENGNYGFSAADQGLGVLLSYAYVPADIEQAVVEMVAWRWKARLHVGIRQEVVGGGGASNVFQTDAYPPSIQPVIDQYQRVHV